MISPNISNFLILANVFLEVSTPHGYVGAFPWKGGETQVFAGLE